MNSVVWYLQSGDLCASPDEQLVSPASQAPPLCCSSVRRWSASTLAMSCLCLSMLWGTAWKRSLFQHFPTSFRQGTQSMWWNSDFNRPWCHSASPPSPWTAGLLRAERGRSHNALSVSPTSVGGEMSKAKVKVWLKRSSSCLLHFCVRRLPVKWRDENYKQCFRGNYSTGFNQECTEVD